MAAVSIIVIYHRVIPFLRPAVRSLLDQTWRDLEVVLVDNGTGTGLAALGEDAGDPRVRLVSLPANLGYSRAFMAGLAQSSGEFIGMHGYDDLALPLRIERQVALLRAEPRLGIVSSLADTIDARGAIIGHEFTLAGGRDQFTYTAYSTPAPAPSFLFRRAVFGQFPLRPDFDLAEDYDLVSRVVEVWTMRCVPEVLVHYRRHPGQVTVQLNDGQTLCVCLVRLLTARRRAGRDEDLAGALAGVGAWLHEAPGQAVLYRRFAAWFRREGFPDQAVYHARKLLSVRRGPAEMVFALGIVAAALVRAPGRAWFLLRLFFAGPLRAHGLRPA